MLRARAITTAAGVGMALISTEHFFSAGLSSPITTRKFLTSDEDRAEVRRALNLAAGLSLAASALIAKILKQPYPLLAAAALVTFYYSEYQRALGTTAFQSGLK